VKADPVPAAEELVVAKGDVAGAEHLLVLEGGARDLGLVVRADSELRNLALPRVVE
jgi:hypothetical protein